MPNASKCHDMSWYSWNAQDAAVEGNQLTFHFLHYVKKQGPLVYDLCSLHLRYTALVYFAVLHFGRRHRNGPARMSLFHMGLGGFCGQVARTFLSQGAFENEILKCDFFQLQNM